MKLILLVICFIFLIACIWLIIEVIGASYKSRKHDISEKSDDWYFPMNIYFGEKDDD